MMSSERLNENSSQETCAGKPVTAVLRTAAQDKSQVPGTNAWNAGGSRLMSS